MRTVKPAMKLRCRAIILVGAHMWTHDGRLPNDEDMEKLLPKMPPAPRAVALAALAEAKELIQ